MSTEYLKTIHPRAEIEGLGSTGREMAEFELRGPSKVTLQVADPLLPLWDFWLPLTSAQTMFK